ncbi:MAG: ATP-binding protein [Patescibacteria group bacterium]
MLIFFIIVTFFISISMASLGYAAFSRNKKSLTNGLFFLLSIVLAVWCASNFLENLLTSADFAIIFLKLDFILGPFVFFLIFLFLLNFPEPNRKLSKYAVWLVLPTLFISGLILTDKIIRNINFDNNKIGFDFGPWFNVYTALILVYLIIAIGYQIVQLHRIIGIKKMQVRYVLFGFAVTSIITLTFNLFLQNTVSREVFIIGNFSPIILIACIYYAIVRYRLMNIGVILRLGAIYTFLLSTIIFIYASASYFLIIFLQVESPWNFIIPSFFITFGFSPIKKFLEKATDQIFFKQQYKFSDVARKIESSIHEIGLNLDKTLEIINKVITDALKVEHGEIMILIPKGNFISRQVIGRETENFKLKHNNPIIKYLNIYKKRILDKDELERDNYNKDIPDVSVNQVIKELVKNDFALVIPIELKNKLIGVYLLGPKKSQDPYTQEDLRLLRHVAWEMSFAIDNASSYEELKRLDKVKSNFVSVVSHQLRTPVTITRYNLELFFDDTISPEEKTETVRSAYYGILSLGRQLDQLVTVLEIEEKKVMLAKKPVKITDLINRVVEDNQINLNNKKIKLTIEDDEINSEVICDATKIKTVLGILLANAINYVSAEGKIDISVKKETFNKKSKLIVAISDNGIGITDDSKPEIFKKFFRSPEAIAVSPNGFGLGLFIAKKIVSAHGGELIFETKEDRGVTFSFSLPIK